MNEKFGIKLTDFGFAKKLETGEALHDLCGTLSYIAPEMIRAELGTNPDGYGREVDMWACGVLLYTLLMGQPPFHHPRKVSANVNLSVNHRLEPDVTSCSNALFTHCHSECFIPLLPPDFTLIFNHDSGRGFILYNRRRFALL